MASALVRSARQKSDWIAGRPGPEAPPFPGDLTRIYRCHCGQLVVGWPTCSGCTNELAARLTRRAPDPKDAA